MVKDIIMEKKQKSITAKRLENIALYYLGRYDSSSFNLQRILRQRVEKSRRLGADVPPEASSWIDEVVAKMQSYGYLDDKRYAENLVRRLRNASRSQSFIRLKLAENGIGEDIISALDLSSAEDEEAALRWAKKHGLGKNPDNYTKDLAKLGRAGFSYEDARKALENCRNEEEI